MKLVLTVRWIMLSISVPGADVDETSKQEVKTALQQYDRTLLVSDPRRCEPKKCVSACRLVCFLRLVPADHRLTGACSEMDVPLHSFHGLCDMSPGQL